MLIDLHWLTSSLIIQNFILCTRFIKRPLRIKFSNIPKIITLHCHVTYLPFTVAVEIPLFHNWHMVCYSTNFIAHKIKSRQTRWLRTTRIYDENDLINRGLNVPCKLSDFLPGENSRSYFRPVPLIDDTVNCSLSNREPRRESLATPANIELMVFPEIGRGAEQRTGGFHRRQARRKGWGRCTVGRCTKRGRIARGMFISVEGK